METMQKLAALEGDGYYSLSNVVTIGSGDNVTVLTTYIDANATVPVSDSDTVFANKYQGTGKGSAVDFQGYSGDVVIDLNYDSSTQIELIAAGSTVYESVTAVRGSDGNSTILGSSAAETIYAGKGSNTIDGGAGRDILNGYTGSDKTGAVTFVFEEGNGKDTISGFTAYDGTNTTTADVLALGDSLAAGDDPEIKITGGNVRLSFNSSDQVTLVDMENQKLFYGNSETAILAEIGNNLEYDANVSHYMGESNATITVADSDQGVNAWMNLGGIEGLEDWGKYDNIRVLDASALTADATLVGGFETNNVIYGGQGVNSLWGGNGGNDTLFGGGSANEYYYLTDGGNDVIENAADGDVVHLLDIDLNNYDVSSLVDGVSEDAVEIKFNDGGSVKVDGSANVTFKITGGHKWTVDRETKEWTYQGQD